MKKKDKQGWNITEDRFVAFLDIMGFKDMIARTKHEDIYKMMIKLDDMSYDNSIIHDRSEDREVLVRTTTYSDSIVMYSKNKNKKSMHAFFGALSGMYQDLLEEGIPFKGAVSFGKMTLDIERTIFFGQPLIDAYLLEGEVNFYGIVIHGSAEELIMNNDEFSFALPYDCPLKRGKSQHLTVFPLFVGDKSKKDETKILLESIHRMRFKTSGHIRKYIDETEKYILKMDEILSEED